MCKWLDFLIFSDKDVKIVGDLRVDVCVDFMWKVSIHLKVVKMKAANLLALG